MMRAHTFTYPPCADINTHRHVGWVNRVFARCVLAAGIDIAAAGHPLNYAATAIALSALMLALAYGMEIQALRWEFERFKDKDGEIDDV